jgi:hypothetical protein
MRGEVVAKPWGFATGSIENENRMMFANNLGFGIHADY